MKDKFFFGRFFRDKILEYKDNLSYLMYSLNKPDKEAGIRKNVLILSSTGNSRGLNYPFHYYRQQLSKQLNFHFRERVSDDLSKKKEEIETFKGDLIFLGMPLRQNSEILPKETLIDFFKSLKKPKNARLIYFDISDQAISPYFDVLPYVDLFLMPFTFKDPVDYRVPYLGGNKFADFMSKHFHIAPTKENEYHTDLFDSHPREDQLHKIMNSWNWMLIRKLVEPFNKQGNKCSTHSPRSIDVMCRFNPLEGWCLFHRTLLYDKLKNLSYKYHMNTSSDKIPLKQYYVELENSKISLSPFGWGEICPKDFESIMKGCLLLKPSVEHLVTFPQLHIANETYVPIAWDFSDLEEKLDFYLENTEQRQMIIQNASRSYESFFTNMEFLNKVKQILEKLGL